MDDLVKSGGSGLVGLLHGKGGEISIPKPFEKDIFLFDTYVAGTTHIEGIEELEPHLNVDDRLAFLENLITGMIRKRLSLRLLTELKSVMFRSRTM
ncbi:MAG: hypothetical protein ACLSHG_04925 [Oscillospiraceae bacterium]